VFVAGFAFVRAAFWVFRGVQITEVLELIISLHMVEDGRALPVSGFEFAVLWALLGDFYFAVSLT